MLQKIIVIFFPKLKLKASRKEKLIGLFYKLLNKLEVNQNLVCFRRSQKSLTDQLLKILKNTKFLVFFSGNYCCNTERARLLKSV
jgi:hypothetical protein